MRRLATICTMFGVFVIGLMLVLPVGQAADASKDLAVKMVLLTAKAARTVYVKGVIADVLRGLSLRQRPGSVSGTGQSTNRMRGSCGWQLAIRRGI